MTKSGTQSVLNITTTNPYCTLSIGTTSISVSFQVAVIMRSDISFISFKEVYYRFYQFNVFGKTCPDSHDQKQRVDLAGKHANAIYNGDLRGAEDELFY